MGKTHAGGLLRLLRVPAAASSYAYLCNRCPVPQRPAAVYVLQHGLACDEAARRGQHGGPQLLQQGRASQQHAGLLLQLASHPEGTVPQLRSGCAEQGIVLNWDGVKQRVERCLNSSLEEAPPVPKAATREVFCVAAL